MKYKDMTNLGKTIVDWKLNRPFVVLMYLIFPVWIIVFTFSDSSIYELIDKLSEIWNVKNN